MKQCKATVLIDDDRARVTRFEFEAGQETGWHRHEFDYVITAITECQMRIALPDGTSNEVAVHAGEAYRRNAGVEHNVINAGIAPMVFVEVELK